MAELSESQALIVASEFGVDARTVVMTHAYLERLAEAPVSVADTIAYLLQPDVMTERLDADRHRSR